jgi:hypothetical protein
MKNSRVISGKFNVLVEIMDRNVTLNCTFMTLQFLLALPTVRRNSIWLFSNIPDKQENKKQRKRDNIWPDCCWEPRRKATYKDKPTKLLFKYIQLTYVWWYNLKCYVDSINAWIILIMKNTSCNLLKLQKGWGEEKQH